MNESIALLLVTLPVQPWKTQSFFAAALIEVNVRDTVSDSFPEESTLLTCTTLSPGRRAMLASQVVLPSTARKEVPFRE